jgi:23S rRNA (uracil1939-C5)-methyltransferase
MSRTATLEIAEIGVRGDGIARTDSGLIFVPYTIGGETVTARIDGRQAALVSVDTASADRAAPPCPHFGTCGGCSVQHITPEAYRNWKTGLLHRAFASADLDTSVIQPGHFCDPHSRRRAVFSAISTEKGVVFGFQQAGSNHVVDIGECHVVLPAIDAARPALKALLERFLPAAKSVHVGVTETLNGLDLAIEGPVTLDDAAKRKASDALRQSPFCRLSVNGEIILALRDTQVEFGGVKVSLPPGGFLQAVAAMEDIMAALVSVHLKKSKRVADLFAGCGTFALRLARSSNVHAVEGDAPSVAALDRAFRAHPGDGLKPVTVERRDLVRRPMMAGELKPYDGLVFDPPRAGAEDQAKEIAQSQIRRVAAVSCNPETLARDLTILIDGGYRLLSVTPVDQFIWTPHLEAVALLEKPKSAKRHWGQM